MPKNKKTYADDDGRTIVDMNVEGMPWYTPRSKRKVAKEDKPTRRETFAMMRVWFASRLPAILAIVVGVGLAVGLTVCWLNGWFIK